MPYVRSGVWKSLTFPDISGEHGDFAVRYSRQSKRPRRSSWTKSGPRKFLDYPAISGQIRPFQLDGRVGVGPPESWEISPKVSLNGMRCQLPRRESRELGSARVLNCPSFSPHCRGHCSVGIEVPPPHLSSLEGSFACLTAKMLERCHEGWQGISVIKSRGPVCERDDLVGKVETGAGNWGYNWWRNNCEVSRYA